MWPSSPWLGGSCSCAGGRDQPGLDAELAQPQPLVGLELDLRARAAARSARGARARAGSRTARAPVRPRSPRTACGRRATARRRTRSGAYTRDSDWTLFWSISFASLRAISTGRTSDLKARENVPSTSPASLDSRLRSTLMRRYREVVAMVAGAQYPARRHGSTTRTRRRCGIATASTPATTARERRARVALVRRSPRRDAAVPAPSAAAQIEAATTSTREPAAAHEPGRISAASAHTADVEQRAAREQRRD